MIFIAVKQGGGESRPEKTDQLDDAQPPRTDEKGGSLRKHQEEILAYFINRLTNAFAEGMNSLIQTAKRKARGFRTY